MQNFLWFAARSAVRKSSPCGLRAVRGLKKSVRGGGVQKNWTAQGSNVQTTICCSHHLCLTLNYAHCFQNGEDRASANNPRCKFACGAAHLKKRPFRRLQQRYTHTRVCLVFCLHRVFQRYFFTVVFPFSKVSLRMLGYNSDSISFI